MDILPFRTSCNRSHSCPKSTRQGTPSLLHQVNAVNMLFFCAQKCGLCYQAEIMDGESLLKKQPFRQHFYLLSLHDLQLASLYRKGPIRSSGKRLHHQLCLLIAIGDPFLHLTQVPCPQVCLHTGIPRVYFPQKHKSITGPAGTKPARSAEKGPPPSPDLLTAQHRLIRRLLNGRVAFFYTVIARFLEAEREVITTGTLAPSRTPIGVAPPTLAVC